MSIPAYLICSSLFSKDHGSLTPYYNAVHPLLEKSGAELLIAGGTDQHLDILEGSWPNPDARITLFKFESMEKLRTFWFSEEYQSIKHLREDVIPPNFTLIAEGFELEEYVPEQ